VKEEKKRKKKKKNPSAFREEKELMLKGI